MKKITSYVESNYIKYFHGRCSYRYRITILIPNINILYCYHETDDKFYQIKNHNIMLY